MLRSIQGEKTFLSLSMFSAVSLIVFIASFYQSIYHAIIPLIWRGWFLPIPGIVVLAVMASAMISLSSYYLISKKNQVKRFLKYLSEYWWVAMRVYIGFSWVAVGLTIWTPSFVKFDFTKLVDYLANKGPYPWYNTFLINFVSPNAQFFARLIQYIQLLVGICLLLGLLTNLGASLALVMNVNFYLAVGWVDPTGAVAAQNLFVAVHEILFILLLAGRQFGVDELLAKQFPRPIVW